MALTVSVADRAFTLQRTQGASFARKCLLRTHHPSTELEDCVRRVFKRRIWCAVWGIRIFCDGCLGGYETTLTHRRSSSVTSFLLLVFKDYYYECTPCCSIGEVPKEQKEKKRRLVDVRLYDISFFVTSHFMLHFVGVAVHIASHICYHLVFNHKHVFHLGLKSQVLEVFVPLLLMSEVRFVG